MIDYLLEVPAICRKKIKQARINAWKRQQIKRVEDQNSVIKALGLYKEDKRNANG